MSVFKRGSQSVKDGARPAPMTWDYSIRYTKPGGFFACRSDKWLVNATCRNDHTCVLSLDVHRIADNGQIWPSYVCPVEELRLSRVRAPRRVGRQSRLRDDGDLNADW